MQHQALLPHEKKQALTRQGPLHCSSTLQSVPFLAFERSLFKMDPPPGILPSSMSAMARFHPGVAVTSSCRTYSGSKCATTGTGRPKERYNSQGLRGQSR